MVETSVPVPVSSCARALKAARPSSQSDRDSMLARTRTHTRLERESRGGEMLSGEVGGEDRVGANQPHPTIPAARCLASDYGRRAGEWESSVVDRPQAPGGVGAGQTNFSSP